MCGLGDVGGVGVVRLLRGGLGGGRRTADGAGLLRAFGRGAGGRAAALAERPTLADASLLQAPDVAEATWRPHLQQLLLLLLLLLLMLMLVLMLLLLLLLMLVLVLAQE